jgi:hypothetical protein
MEMNSEGFDLTVINDIGDNFQYLLNGKLHSFELKSEI